MKQHHTQHIVKLIAAVGALIALSGCETLRSVVSVERPQVRVEGAELTALSFDGAEVTVELAISNPNPIGISMSGFSYELLIEGNRFLDGDISEAIQIDPMDTSSLKVPVAFGFRELAETVQSFGDAEEAAYEVNLALRFDLPLLGPISVPVQAAGTFPVVRAPTVRLDTVHLDSLGLSGAEFRLELVVYNPNAFGLSIDSLSYEFSVDRDPWVSGTAPRRQSIAPKQESVLSLPFTLRLISLGRTVRDILTGQDTLQYELDIAATVGTDLALIPSVNLPFSVSGTVPLRR